MKRQTVNLPGNHKVEPCNQEGFTVIELMIATIIASLIMLAGASALVQIGRMFYRGVTAARTQEVARTVIDDVSRPIQFAAQDVQSETATGPNGERAYCIGRQRYSYVRNRQLVETVNDATKETKYGLWQDSMTADGPCVPLEIAAGNDNFKTHASSEPDSGKELLGRFMRLAEFKVAKDGGNSLYRVTVRIVHGEDDLLEDPSVLASEATAGQVACRGGSIGSQFCAVSGLTTVVTRRL